MDIFAEKTICKTFRHSNNKTYIHSEGEYTLFLYSKNKKELESISKISLESYEVLLDNNLKIAYHVGKHSDPHNIYNYKDGFLMQIIIYGENAKNLIEKGINIFFKDNILVYQEILFNDNNFKEYESELIKEDDCFYVKVISDNIDKLSFTYQYIENGKFYEYYKKKLINNLIKVPSIKGEYFGISISNSDILGGLEHKHIILGHIGVPSGKILYDLENHNEYFPRMRNYSLYKSYVINYKNEKQLKSLEHFINNYKYDDLTIYSNIINEIPFDIKNKNINFITYGKSDDKDIILLDLLKDKPIDRPHSYFLFSEQDNNFSDKLSYFFNFIKPNQYTFENPWLNITENEFLFKSYEYGISYSLNKELILNKALLQEKKLKIKNSLCNSCSKYFKCRNILSFPYGDISSYVKKNNCNLKRYI